MIESNHGRFVATLHNQTVQSKGHEMVKTEALNSLMANAVWILFVNDCCPPSC